MDTPENSKSVWARLKGILYGHDATPAKPPPDTPPKHRSTLEESGAFPEGWLGNRDYSDEILKK